jgi:hypothetical protein
MNPNILEVPRGVPGLANLRLDLSEIHASLARVEEIKVLTKFKAPELLTVFNKAFIEANKLVNEVELARVTAERTVDRTRARILLDKVPEILKAKGLSTPKSPMGSEDMRQAVLDCDDDYCGAVDALKQIEAALTHLKNYVKAIVFAYESVKKVLGEQAFNHSSGIGNNTPHMGGEDENLTAGQTERPRGAANFAKRNHYSL